MNNQTYINLLETWKLELNLFNQGQYLSIQDYPYYLSSPKAFSEIDLTKPPQPFWGNILNPSVIVLFNNPNISQTNDPHYYQALLENLTGEKPFDFLENIQGNPIWKDNSDAQYWMNRFKDIKNELLANEHSIYDYNTFIGEFEFHGYNSKTFRAFPKTTFDQGYLRTQIALFEHIRFLINSVNPIIIIARGKRLWLEALNLDENDQRVIVVRSPRSAYLSKRDGEKGNIHPVEFESIITRIKMDAHDKKTRKSD